MKAKAFKIVNLILAVLVCVFALSHAFAWFAEDMRKSEDKFDGSSSSPYFASGDGLTEDTAFMLTNQYHLYNLAWLQDTGKFGENTYYFKLKNDITIDNGFWLPPIGTDANPFRGYFYGDNKSITNLQITTDSTKLTGVVSGTSVKFSNAVGMFGMTAEDTIKTAKIKDFNLINPIVEVATSNAVYDPDSSAKTNVGFAIGFANCGAENIGVLDGKLAVKKSGYSSKNSIVGDYDGTKVNGDEIDSDVGSDGDTGQFIPQVFAEKASNLGSIMSGSSFNGSTWVLPYNGTVTSGFAGVGLGAFSLIAGNTTEIRDASVSSFTYYTTKSTGSSIPTYNSTGGTLNVSLAATDNGNTEDGEAIRKKVLNGSTEITNLSKLLYINNSPTKVSSGLKAVYETNVVYSSSHSSTVYTNCIKVRVKNSSTKIFVIASSGGNEDRYLGVYKVFGSETDTIKDFDTRVNNAAYDESASGFVRANPLMQLLLPSSGAKVACEFDLSGEDAGAGTYQINSTKSGINIYYVSVTGTTEGDSGSTVSDPKLYNVDFIYKDSSSNVVLINTATPTNVIVKFKTTDITFLYFYRPTDGKDGNNYTLDVEYNGTQPTAKSTGAGGNCNITPNGELTVA